MKTVEQLAREAGPLISTPFDKWCERFHDLAIAQYRESLLAGVGDAVAYVMLDSWVTGQSWPDDCFMSPVKPLEEATALYTADQLVAAVAIERERCAKVCEEDAFVEQWKGLTEAAQRIRTRGVNE